LDKNWEVPAHYLQKARLLRDDLLKTLDKEVLLHGDLHHDNILQNGDDWMVIDPKGVIGEPAFEIAAFIRNPIPELLTHKKALNIILDRINRCSEILKFPKQKIINWCYVQAILAWIWALENKNDDFYFKNLADLVERITDTLS
jgi:streptomycin 6-kinase